MKTIWKYELDILGYQTVCMKEGARILHVGSQRIPAGVDIDSPTRERICIWAEVDDQAEDEHRVFQIAMTGLPLTDRYDGDGLVRKHLATILLNGDQWVGHVGERIQPARAIAEALSDLL